MMIPKEKPGWITQLLTQMSETSRDVTVICPGQESLPSRSPLNFTLWGGHNAPSASNPDRGNRAMWR
jgi:hypothetical protein